MQKAKRKKPFMRLLHRYLGYFTAGIMALYAISGVLLIYRDTNFLKKENKIEEVIARNIAKEELGKTLKIKRLDVKEIKDGIYYFDEGTYDSTTGKAVYTKKELPFVLDKMTKLHKAESKNPWSPLNAFFGFTLFFFVVSSFWMFSWKSKAFRKGMIYAGIGFIFALIMLFLS